MVSPFEHVKVSERPVQRVNYLHAQRPHLGVRFNRIVVDIGKFLWPGLPERHGNGAGTGTDVNNDEGSPGTGRLDPRLPERLPARVGMMALVVVGVAEGEQIGVGRVKLTVALGRLGLVCRARIGLKRLLPGLFDNLNERAVITGQPTRHGTTLQAEPSQVATDLSAVRREGRGGVDEPSAAAPPTANRGVACWAGTFGGVGSVDRVVPAAGRHGGDGTAVARALGLEPDSLLDLSQNLNPFAPDVGALAKRHLGELRRYPDPAGASQLLAGAMGVEPGRLLLANGAAEAISLAAAEIGGQVQTEPEFGLHPRGDTGPVWRSDPHTPSGRLAGRDEAADVWDEAFYALATGRWTANRDGIVVGSLTKTFACPGLRLGYLISDEAARFARRQPHWSVGSLALALLGDLLARADLSGWAAAIAAARSELVEVLAARGLEVQAADAPWVLVQAPGLREALAPHGVLVRDCAGFGLDGTARIAVPHADGLARLAAALDRAGFTDRGAGAHFVSGGGRSPGEPIERSLR